MQKKRQTITKIKDIKKNNLIEFVLIVAIILIVNIIGAFLFLRLDLTSERRYTLSPATKDLLKSVNDHVYFRVYLEGEFPAGFKKLRRETKEMLDEMRAHSKFIDYDFINPLASSTKQERDETIKTLVDKGLMPTDLQIRTSEGTEQKVIFPAALVTYRDKELILDLLDDQVNTTSETVLNNSIQNLEFKIADIISKLSQLQKPAIAFTEGNGELTDGEMADITQTLVKNYKVDRITIGGKISALTRRSEPDKNGNIRILPNYETIVIAKPTKAISDRDKFIIDQYIMYGGKVLWLIDPVLASMDSLQMSESTVGVDLNVRLDDQLFKYGVRLNKNLVLDLNAASIPLRTGQVGTQPKIEFFKWYYFPLLNQGSNHPVVRNINALKADFVSSIDTVMADGVKKYPLLRTSAYSRIVGTPALITLTMLRDKPDQRMFNKPGQVVAYLLEGTFTSLYANRMPPEIAESKEIGFLESSRPTAMIVAADGDIIRNQFHVPKGYPLPLGYDQFTRQTYGNKDFILNAISYLADSSNLISIRSRDLKLRLLDVSKIASSRLQWQLINVVTPITAVLLFGLVLAIIRKKRYAR